MAKPSLAGLLAVYSVLLLLAALYQAPLDPIRHAVLVTSAVLVFYSAVAAAYLASAAGGSKSVYALGVLHSMLYALYPLDARLSLTAGSLAGLAAASLASISAKGAGRIAALSLTPVYALGVYAAVTKLLTPCSLDPLYAIPAAAVAPVNIHALVHTYRLKPRWLPLVASLSYAAAYTLGAPALRLYTGVYAGVTAALTVAALRSSLYRGLRGVAKKAHRYLLAGQALVAVSAATYTLTQGDVIMVAHALAMGYIASHVFTHAPLMLPVMLRARSPHRYRLEVYPLAVASLYARLASLSHASLAFFAVALALLAYNTLPVRRQHIRG